MQYTKIEEIASGLSKDRQMLLKRFLERNWFKNTDFVLQKEILTLPEDWDGYLSDLVKRKDETGGLILLKLSDFKRGDYMAFTRFLVRVVQTKQEINYREYMSFKYGSNPGYRGIIFLESEGKITHFLIKKTEKFPVDDLVYDTFGDTIQFRQGTLVNLPKNAEKEIKRQLGIEELNIKRFIDLGQIYTDVGRSNLHLSLFAAIIDVSDNSFKLKSLKDKIISDTKKVSFELLIEPIDRLHEYIHKVDDSYFLACILRLSSMGIIDLYGKSYTETL